MRKKLREIIRKELDDKYSNLLHIVDRENLSNSLTRKIMNFLVKLEKKNKNEKI